MRLWPLAPQPSATLSHHHTFLFQINMSSDPMLQEGAETSLNGPDQPPPPSNERPSQPAPSRDRTWKRTPTTDILLLGPSVSGKSSLINMASGNNNQVVSEGVGTNMAYFRATRAFTIGERWFRLIDSPGFDPTSLSDSELMKRVIVYLIKSRDNPRLAGILYLHPEGKDIEDERLKGIMEALKFLVGDSWLPSVTIAVTTDEVAADSGIITRLREPTSPFYSLSSKGANILPLSFELQEIRDILLGFKPGPPRPRFLNEVRWNPPDRNIRGLDRFVEEIVGHRRRETAGKIGRQRKITHEESEAGSQQLRMALDTAEIELKFLRSQLEQTRSEYASLRSELQLNDNTEQGKITRSLGDLNRAINGFGRSVAEYVVVKFAATLEKDNPTTLDASDPIGLQDQFRHQVGKYSLVASSSNEGLAIEDFIDLALRSFLCQTLCKDVFAPFHPTLAASPDSGAIASLYEKVRRRVSPTVAAKWRESTFMALSEGHEFDKPAIEAQVKNLVSGDIQHLLCNIFGPSTDIALPEYLCSQLRDIVTLAWELNYLLKGEVLALGDFQPLCHEYGVPFDPKTMVGLEPHKQRNPDDIVIALCTVELGLIRYYSKGVENDTNPSVVCQAKVVTPAIYG
ncbi:unnamed protein product [Rhizoctonia solani]|uniref:G domain-containing protein n=1 Tax=Rhizoctonia solani TaxID=456999 RepID=A0A8H3DR12_9AGAM|nr:unnamed protein product [Rhizoctonia solani]